MPRALVFLCTIVAAFPGSLDAAPPISDDVSVSAEVSAVARTLGLDPPRDRARFVAEFARLLYTPPLGRSPAVAALLNPQLIDRALVAAERPIRVPLPLSVDVWSRVVFKRPVKPDEVLGLILTDRRAALVCYALSGLDDETLAYVAQHGSLLAVLHEQHAAAFGAFGGSLRIRGDRIEPPGGAAAAPLWEAVVRQSLGNPEAFARALFGMNDGRVAYLYDAVAQLDPPNAAFVLGAFLHDPDARILRFAALVDIVNRSYREWRLETLPFSRPLHDVALVAMRARVEHDGTPIAPASRAFWAAVFASQSLDRDSIVLSQEPGAEQPIDAAWLAQTTSGNDMFWRGDRIDQFAFGQRVFGGVPPDALAAAVVAIRAFPRQRMLSLTLERMGVTAAPVYAAIARQAERLVDGGPGRQFRVLAQLQSAVAIVARMTTAASLSRAQGERLVQSLFSVPVDGERYAGALAGWLRRELMPLLPAPGDQTDGRDIGAIEARIIAGLAGSPAGDNAPTVEWEGQTYRFDLAAGEQQRLRSIRRRQEGWSVDVAMALEALARKLAAENLTIDGVREVAAELAAFPDTFDRRLDAPAETRPPGVEPPRRMRDLVAKWSEELARAVRGSDVKRASRLAPVMTEAVDDLLADGLLSLAYAADLGDPDGPAMLARNVALRHDFGFGRKDADVRARSIWAIPRQDFLPGVPWHVTGSVLGLDIAMASLSLKRISPDRFAEAPRLSSNERDAFAVGVALMNPRLLRDADRDAVVTAIARGRGRVAALAHGGESLASVADALGMDGWRRRGIAWMLAEDRDGISSMFSLAEFLTLGGVQSGASLEAWGTSALQAEGCACLRLTTPRRWRLLSGRPQLAFMAFGVADLNLHIAEMLGAMRLPAALERHVLLAAVLDFTEEVAPTDYNDWWSLARFAQGISRERIEDYVASATAVDGPLVPEETGAVTFP